MKGIRPAFAALEVLLVLPAAIFLLALALAVIQPVFGTGHIVGWYARHLVLGLYVSLFALPLAALAGGCAFTLYGWNRDGGLRRFVLEAIRGAREQWAHLLVAAAAVTAGLTLLVVALHMITE